MTDRKDGGPAFPLPMAVGPAGDLYDASQTDPGMSLRDYFAGQALAGHWSQSNPDLVRNMAEAADENFDGDIADMLAAAAYKAADSMLKAREGSNDD